MAYSAAAMYGGATFVGMLEGVLPGGSRFSPIPSALALIVVVALLLWGRRLPMWAMAALGPIGAMLIAIAIATTVPVQVFEDKRLIGTSDMDRIMLPVGEHFLEIE